MTQGSPWSVLKHIAAKMPKVVREHEILRIAATISAKDANEAMSRARTEVLRWVQNRSGGRLPDEAWNYKSFEFLSGGRNSVGVRLDNGATDIWALRADDPDKFVPGRIWTTEVVIGAMHNKLPLLCIRSLASTAEEDLVITPHSPGLIQQITDRYSLWSGKYELSAKPWFISSSSDADSLVSMILDEERRLPVFVLTTSTKQGRPMIDADELARAVLGLAYVVVLPSYHAAKLTDAFGKQRSVFGGAVRAYLPGFDVECNPYEHRLILAESLSTEDGVAQGARWMRTLAANESVKRQRLGRDVLAFSEIRNASLEHRQQQLKDSGASDTEQLEAAKSRIAALEKQIKEDKATLEYFAHEHEQAEQRAEASEAQARASALRIQHLATQLKDRGGTNDNIQLPSTWNEFADWCDVNFAGQLVLHQRARRGVKSPVFEDVELAARCILWLAQECRERRIHSGEGTLREEVVQDGIRNAHCGNDQYDVMWQGRAYTADWHIKKGGNTRDPRRCLRIYYFWDSVSQQIVVTDMPAHRVTGAT